MSCFGCTQEATEKDREFNKFLNNAKIKAIEEKKPQAVCFDPIQGFFITDATIAIRERFQIKDIISGL